MRLRETIEVRRSLEEAFAYVADFSTTAEWDPGIAEAARVGEGPIGLGTQFDLVAVFRGSRVPFRYTVVSYDENRRIALDGEAPKSRTYDDITFERLPNGTRIVYEADLRMKGIYRVVEPFVRGTFRRIAEKGVGGLKATLDSTG